MGTSNRMPAGLAAFAMAVAGSGGGIGEAGPVLDAVTARALNCGTSTGTAGYYIPDSQDPLTSQQRFTAIPSGGVDMLVGNATWTLTRDSALGLDFTGMNYYDGQSFLVPKKLGVNSAKDLNGATVCVAPGTIIELNLADYFAPRK